MSRPLWVAQIFSKFNQVATTALPKDIRRFGAAQSGGLAQLGERLHGMQEVRGSSPLSSTFLKP